MATDRVTIEGYTITRKMFDDAKQAGIANWTQRSYGVEPSGGCEFCEIFIRRFNKEQKLERPLHLACPVYDGIKSAGQCCKEWQDWHSMAVRCSIKQAIPQAKAVLARIQSLDWSTWMKKYFTINDLRVGDRFYSAYMGGQYWITGIFEVTHDTTMPPPEHSDCFIDNRDNFGVSDLPFGPWSIPIVKVKPIYILPYPGYDSYDFDWEKYVPVKDKPKHYDGEPCNLPVSAISNRPLCSGKRLVYTGEFRTVPKEKMEWRELNVLSSGSMVATFGWSRFPVWILREEPVKPKPRKGTVCAAPRSDDVPKEGVFIFGDDGKQYPKEGDYILGENGPRDGMIFKTLLNYAPYATRYILTHVMPKYKVGDEVTYWPTGDTFKIGRCIYDEQLGMYIYYKEECIIYFQQDTLIPAMPKPEPKYKKKQWVIIQGQMHTPRCIEKEPLFSGNNFHYRFYTENYVLSNCSENMILRLAKPIDFAKEFNGVKVWMEKYDGAVREYRRGKGYGSNYWSILDQLEIERNIAAGIPIVPEEVCE